MSSYDLMNIITLQSLLEDMFGYDPDPVQPLKERANALSGDSLFKCPTRAFKTVSAIKC